MHLPVLPIFLMTSSILYHQALTLALLLVLHGHPEAVIKASRQDSKLPQITINSVPSSGLCDCQHIQTQQCRYCAANLLLVIYSITLTGAKA